MVEVDVVVYSPGSTLTGGVPREQWWSVLSGETVLFVDRIFHSKSPGFSKTSSPQSVQVYVPYLNLVPHLGSCHSPGSPRALPKNRGCWRIHYSSQRISCAERARFDGHNYTPYIDPREKRKKMMFRSRIRNEIARLTRNITPEEVVGPKYGGSPSGVTWQCSGPHSAPN